MKIIRYDQKALPTPGVTALSRVEEGSHVVYDHLHFDFQDVSGETMPMLERFVTQVNGEAAKPVLTWQNFRRITFHEVMALWRSSGYPLDRRLPQILSDPDLFGAPTAHLTAKFTGVPLGLEYARFLDLYRRGVEMVQQLKSTGYIESERVSFRVEMKDGELNLSRVPTLCPVRALDKVSLESLDRTFRTTEIHVSFERLERVHPLLLTDLFKQGFYTAFRFDESTGHYSVIATIQGFEQEILLIAADMYNWLRIEVAEGGIGCPVVLKKEDITRFCVFGPSPKLQMVVEPREV